MHVRVCRCVRLRICVLEPHIYLFHNFFVFSASLLLLPYHVVCITPCLKLSSSLLCDSHGTTAVAQYVCVDHSYAFVGMIYARVSCVCAMIRKHVACATTAAMFNVNIMLSRSSTGVPADYLVLLFCLSNNTAAHAPFSRQHNLTRHLQKGASFRYRVRFMSSQVVSITCRSQPTCWCGCGSVFHVFHANTHGPQHVSRLAKVLKITWKH